jgi:hypothetical protein
MNVLKLQGHYLVYIFELRAMRSPYLHPRNVLINFLFPVSILSILYDTHTFFLSFSWLRA